MLQAELNISTSCGRRCSKVERNEVRRMATTESADERKHRIRQLADEFVNRSIVGTSQRAVETKEQVEEEAGEVTDLQPLAWKINELVDGLVDENSDLGKRFTNMANEVINFAQITAGERASYSLEMPNIQTRSPPCWKYADDEELDTSINTRLGTNPSPDHEGWVLYVVTTYLVKWGTGLGERLDERAVLMKADPGMAHRDDNLD
jgi:hypothetical protein